MRKLFIGLLLAVASVFTVSAVPTISDDVSFGVGVVSNLHFNEFGVVVNAYDVLIDRVGVYTGFNVDAGDPDHTMYSLSVGGNFRAVDNLYLFGGTKIGIQSTVDERVELGAEYYVFNNVGLKVKFEFPNFDVDNVYLGVGFRI